MSNFEDFEVGGQRFRLAQIPCEVAGAHYEHVVKLLKPFAGVLTELKEEEALQALQSVQSGQQEAKDAQDRGEELTDEQRLEAKQNSLRAGLAFGQAIFRQFDTIACSLSEPTVKPLRVMFFKHCQYQPSTETHKSMNGGEVWLPVGNFKEVLFARKHRMFLEWLLSCVLLEYSDFLPGTGLLPMIQAMVGKGSDSQSG